MNDSYNELLVKAISARKNAYAPYSGFKVGAALLCEDGTVYTGCNIECSSFSLTNCAERTAFFNALSEGKHSFKAIAIVGGHSDVETSEPCFPCGACRQVMAEFCSEDFTIVLFDRTLKLSELMPYSFKL